MRLLVTGGAGFIGSHVTRRLIADGHEAVVLDNFHDFYARSIKEANVASFRGQAKLVEGDIRDGALVRKVLGEGKFDAVIHLAARAGVRPSVENPMAYIETNVLGTQVLLEEVRRSGVPRFIFASSSSVYGATREIPFREDMPLRQTLSPYAATKLSGEYLCSTYAHLYGLRVICLRFFTVYGPAQRPDLAIHKFTRAIDRGEPIPQFGDGSSRRDYTYVDDTVQGVMGALFFSGNLFEVLNLGESQTTSLSELIHCIEAALGKRAIIERLPEQKGDMPQTCADISKARALLGYNPKVPIESGIPLFVEWYLQHREL